MEIKRAIVVYTHSDMEDVWPMFFGQLKKYMSDYKVYVCIDEENDTISNDIIRLRYDDTKKYTDRLYQIIDGIEEDVFLFIHEDMVLYDTPDYNSLNKYFEYVEQELVDSIKLISVGSYFVDAVEGLVKSDLSKFSIQPTIISKSRLKVLLEECAGMGIWDFEKKVSDSDSDVMIRSIAKRRGLLHYDSSVFPYIATAICKGKWNYTEYENELTPLWKEYNINPFERGIL